MPTGALIVWLAGLLGCLVAVYALFMWKKWGFWLYCGLEVVLFVWNLSNGVAVAQAIYGLLSIPILYGVLQIGKQNKAWSQLK
jgi:hypothetical protein